jgi:glycerol kinase
MQHVLAIDQGTTGSTVLVVDPGRAVRGRGYREFAQHFPAPGLVEHDPEQIVASVEGAIADALADAGIDGRSVAGIGITNQRETTIVWERATGRPVHPAIVWQDRRTAGWCRALRDAGHEAKVRTHTGLPIDPYFSASKLAWLLEQGDHRTRAERGELQFGTVDTFLLHRLSGGRVHATEPSNASRTLLLDLRTASWCDELLALFGVPAAMLPEIRPSAGPFGETRGFAGLPDGVPVTGIAGDQQAALFGQGCFDTGSAKCTFGTGSFLLLNTGEKAVPSQHGLLTTIAWQIGERRTYALEGGAFVAGAAVQWLRDGLGIIATAADVEALARSVPDAGGVIVVPAFAGLGAPHWRPEARGLVTGITRGTTRAHLARATLEGIAHQNADLLDAMAEDLGRPLSTLRVDGGAAANDLLLQIQSDLIGVPVERPHQLEATALGAALLAGLGLGWWSLDELRRNTAPTRTFTPSLTAPTRTHSRLAWRSAVHFL